MTKPQKPQCSARVEGVNAAGASETFFCLLREGHRGAHQYHESMARESDEAPKHVAGTRSGA